MAAILSRTQCVNWTIYFTDTCMLDGVRHILAGTYFIGIHDGVIKWKHIPRYWPFVRGLHRSPVNSRHKGQWRGALLFSLICACINDWVNNRDAGDLRRHRAHYDVTVMLQKMTVYFCLLCHFGNGVVIRQHEKYRFCDWFSQVRDYAVITLLNYAKKTSRRRCDMLISLSSDYNVIF